MRIRHSAIVFAVAGLLLLAGCASAASNYPKASALLSTLQRMSSDTDYKLSVDTFQGMLSKLTSAYEGFYYSDEYSKVPEFAAAAKAVGAAYVEEYKVRYAASEPLDTDKLTALVDTEKQKTKEAGDLLNQGK